MKTCQKRKVLKIAKRFWETGNPLDFLMHQQVINLSISHSGICFNFMVKLFAVFL